MDSMVCTRFEIRKKEKRQKNDALIIYNYNVEDIESIFEI